MLVSEPLSSASQGHPPSSRPADDLIYALPSPEESPPSYYDATHSSTSPLLVGQPVDYGVFRAYVDPDESSEASTEADNNTEQHLPEWLGQVFAVMVIVGVLYLFWSIIAQPDPDRDLHGYA